jgi:hypothetical protein
LDIISFNFNPKIDSDVTQKNEKRTQPGKICGKSGKLRAVNFDRANGLRAR